MSSNLIKQPYEMILDPTGGGGRAKPVANGKFYVGEIDKDPVANPRTDIAYKDESGQERPLTSPLTLNNSGAFVVSKNDGTIIQPYMKDAVGFSVLITDSRGSDVYSNNNIGDAGNIDEALQEKLPDYTDIVYQDVESMVSGTPIASSAGYKIRTSGYYKGGDGGGDFYTVANTADLIDSYGVDAQTMINDDCAGVFLLDNGMVAVRNYSPKIDVRQMGFKPCTTTYLSERLGWTPEVGSFDNAAMFQRYDNLINKMSSHITTFSGSFAVGFTGYSQAAGDNNTCCRYSSKNGKLIGTVRPSLIALPLADAMVLRTPINSDSDYSSKIEYLELDSFTVCGNWSQQTWAGPTGLESLADNPLSGWTTGDKLVYDQNGLSTVNIKKLITLNSGASHCGQDGMPSGSVDYFKHTNLLCEWTGKGNNSNFTLNEGLYLDPIHNYANESPSDDKAKYTLSGDGYAGVGCQNIDESVDNSGLITLIRPKGFQDNGRNCLFSVIQGTKNPRVIVKDPNLHAKNRNIITTSYKPNAGGVFELDGGDIYKDGTGRSMSLVNTSFVSFKNKPYLHITNNNDGRIDVSGTTTTVEGSFRENGAVSNSILLNDVAKIKLNDLSCRAVGMINCLSATIYNSSISSKLQTTGVNDWSFYNNEGSDHPEKSPNELRADVAKSSVSITANSFTDVVFTVDGASVGDFVDAIAATSPTSEELVSSVARVTASNIVTVRLFNTTGSTITIGSNIWSVVVRKRNVII